MRRPIALLALLGILGCSRRDPPPPPAAAPLDVSQKQVLAESLEQCFAVNCEGPETRIAQLPPDSPLRNSPEARAIEYRRMAEQLLASDVEPDLQKRRTMLIAIQDSQAADQMLRALATQRLMSLGRPPPTSFTVVFAGDAGVSSGSPPPTVGNAAGLASASGGPPGPNPFVLAKGGKKGLAKARAILEPKVVKGQATAEETRLLFSVCKQLKDKKCEIEAHENMR